MEDPYFLNIRKPSNGSISVRGKKPSAQDFNLRAVKQIKTMVIAMMNPKVIEEGMKDGSIVQGGTGFGRYCFYGCHCLPDHEHASKKNRSENPKMGSTRRVNKWACATNVSRINTMGNATKSLP